VIGRNSRVPIRAICIWERRGEIIWRGLVNDVTWKIGPIGVSGTAVGSVGLESSAGYLRGCFSSIFDLAIARNIRLGGTRNLQIRAEMFNAPNSSIITNRNTTANFDNPGNPVTITNLPYDANGNVVPSRSLPRGAGFGVATEYQNPANGSGAGEVLLLRLFQVLVSDRPPA
jgi:hypothetical protein